MISDGAIGVPRADVHGVRVDGTAWTRSRWVLHVRLRRSLARRVPSRLGERLPAPDREGHLAYVTPAPRRIHGTTEQSPTMGGVAEVPIWAWIRMIVARTTPQIAHVTPSVRRRRLDSYESARVRSGRASAVAVSM